jgi:hypothetical protein
MVLILFTESLDVRFTAGIKEFPAALLPRFFELGRRDVPVRPTFPGQGTQVLAEIFHGGPAEEPVAVVDRTGLKDNHVQHGQGAQAFPCSQRTERRFRRRFGFGTVMPNMQFESKSAG